MSVKFLLGLDDVEIVNAYGNTRSEEYIKMNPCHCAPMIELEDGVAIWESNAVMRHLCESAGEKGEKLYPKDLVTKARINMALDWRQTSLYKCLPSIGYIAFGMPSDDDKAKADFKTLMDEVFPVLTGTFLAGKKFIYSDTITIADLAVAPALTFIRARKNFWAKVPDDVKEYYERVLAAVPDNKENFDALIGMCEGCNNELEP